MGNEGEVGCPIDNSDGLYDRPLETDVWDPVIDALVRWWKQFREDFAYDNDVQSGPSRGSNRRVDPVSATESAIHTAAMRARMQDFVDFPDEPIIPMWAKGMIDPEKNQIS